MIIGDLNSRMSILHDFVEKNELGSEMNTSGEPTTVLNIDDATSLNSIVKQERISNDVHVNENGRELLSICKLNDLFIFNGRIGASPECSYTSNTPQGSSVVDYITGDGCMLSYAAKININ